SRRLPALGGLAPSQRRGLIGHRADRPPERRLSSAVARVNLGRHMNIVGPALEREQEIEDILRSLPRWFGIEKALLMYVADSTTRPTFAAEVNGRLAGFITLTRHF